jgi:catechol 2,3-dioxygenase-like lactoylglutathione lyase family enzyme
MAGPALALDHCVLHVSDLEVSSRFYSAVLGAEVIDRGRDRWAYRFAGGQLSVHGVGLSAGPFARVPVVPGNSDLCFEWDGPIAEAVAHLGRHGVEVELGPAERFGARGNGASVYFRDPDGSLLEFISYAD